MLTIWDPKSSFCLTLSHCHHNLQLSPQKFSWLCQDGVGTRQTDVSPSCTPILPLFPDRWKLPCKEQDFQREVNLQLTVLSHYLKPPSLQVHSLSGGIKCIFLDTYYHYTHFPIQKTWSFTWQKSKQCRIRNLLQLLVTIWSVPKWRAASLLLVPHHTSPTCWGQWLSNCAFWLVGRITQEWLHLPRLPITKGFICIYSTDYCNGF